MQEPIALISAQVTLSVHVALMQELVAQMSVEVASVQA